jgi:hypothetical protein
MADNPFKQFAQVPELPSNPFRRYAPDYVPSWSEIPGQALENAGTSAVNLAKNVVQPILHPIDTAKAFYDIGKGLVSKTAGALGAQQDPAEKEKNEAAANAVGEFLRERYGSVDAFKKTLAEDPVGAIADVSMVLTGGGSVADRQRRTGHESDRQRDWKGSRPGSRHHVGGWAAPH